MQQSLPRRLAAASVLCLLVSLHAATAAEGPPDEQATVPGPLASSTPISAENVIMVTARKREETLQDVPLSVATLTADQLQGLGLRGDEDVANYTIGFRTLQQTGRDIDRPTIRGMAAPASRGEPNASYFIDGVFVSTSISTATTSAVERVEVLRGPQSAQFGRATFSGAINYVTRKPTDEFQAEFNSRAGTHDDYNLGGWMSGPIIEGQLRYLLSGNFSKYGGQWHNAIRRGNPGSLGPADPGAASWESETRPNVLPVRVFLKDSLGSSAPLDENSRIQQADHTRLGGEETTDALVKLVWNPTDATEVSLKYGYTDGEDKHFPSLIAADLNCYVPVPGKESEPWYSTSQGAYCNEWTIDGLENRINIPDMRYGVVFVNADSPGNPLPASAYVAAPAEPGTYRTQNRVLFELLQGIGDYDLTVRGAWNNDEFQQVFDLDHTEVRPVWGLFSFDNQRDIDDYSAEIRLDSPAANPIRGSIGLYWYDQDRENRVRNFLGPSVTLGFNAATFGPSTFLDITNKAVFGSLEIDLSDEWTLTVEGRYAEDEKVQSGGALTASPTLPKTVKLKFDSFTPRFTLRYQPMDDLTLYLQIAEGNKPGDFNTEFFRSSTSAAGVLAGLNGCVPPPPPEPLAVIPCDGAPAAIVAEENQWTYEVGVKAAWLDRRATTNLAMYYIDWTNQGLFTKVNILQNTDPASYLTTTILRNVGKSEVIGAELENSFRVTDNLTLVANYGYTDSRYLDGVDSALEDTTGDGSLHNKRVPSVSRHSVVLGGYLVAPLSDDLELFLSPDYIYNSKRYAGASNLGWIGAQKLVNMRLGVQSSAWTVTAYVRNLLDDETPVAVLDFENFGLTDVNYPLNQYGNLLTDRNPRLFSINPQRGRDYGIEFQYRFR